MLQYRGNNAASKLKLERKGESLCGIRPSGCCNGVDLECFGCHPGLLAIGIPCGQQPIQDEYKGRVLENSSENFQSEQRRESTRDCFCDKSCVNFDDCCDDYSECSSWETTENCNWPEDKPKDFKSSCKLRGSCCSGVDLNCYGCNPVLLSKGIPCEQQKSIHPEDATAETQKENARDCFCDTSCIVFQVRVLNQNKTKNCIGFRFVEDYCLASFDFDLKPCY